MKAITLTQPWATLVAIGAKQYETRSWGTSYRGPLAIHAAKGFPKWAQDLAHVEASFHETMQGISLPRGVVIAICRLAACRQILEGMDPLWPSVREREFGDWTLGRYFWQLVDITALPRPIPAKGALGLWEWTRS